MSVKLISVTRGAGEMEGSSAEDIITYAARVSNPSNQENFETGPKLLRYCIENSHWSIFEQAGMTLEVVTSRGISAQILRHKFQAQEFSQRYAEPTSYVSYDARRQDTKNRQNSFDDLPEDVKILYKNTQEDIWNHAHARYKQLIVRGVCRENARMILPMNTETRLYLTNSARGWLHYIKVRTDASTQLEHRQIAEQCKVIFRQQFPHTSEALGWQQS